MRTTRSLIQIPTEKPTLEAVRNQFEAWRKRKGRWSPIPDFLWEAAVELCRDHSIRRVSQALRLNYSCLKNRVTGSTDRLSPVKQGADLSFVKLDLGTPVRPLEWWVEMEAPDGAKMRMSFRGGWRDFDPVELGRAFWRQGR